MEREIEPEFKVLFIAFACEPGRGSEPGVGWNFVEEESRRRPVWVILCSEYRDAVERYLRDRHSYHPIHVTYVDIPGFHWLFHSFLGNNIYYYFWQFIAGRVGKKLHQRERFDIVQHVSYERYWMHSAGAMVGAPFIFGPVGGGEFYPKGLLPGLNIGAKLVSFFGNLVRNVMTLDPSVRRTLRRAVKIIPSVNVTSQRIREFGFEPEPVMISLLPKLTPQVLLPRGDRKIFRFISIGRLPYWKGVQFGIEAFARAFGEPGSPEAEYLIIGSGTNRNNLKRLAKKLGVGDKVKFLGNLPYAECNELLRESDAMIHPSMRDSAGLVLESLAYGVPVVCLDVGMPALLVNNECGCVVSTELGVEGVIDKIAIECKRWAEDEVSFERLREAAIARASELSREERTNVLEKLYQSIIMSPK